MNKRINTPWGLSDDAGTVIAPGIIAYTTPSHGGYHLSAERLAAMPAALRALRPFSGSTGWYEEDCDWAIVVLAFPEHFQPAHVRDAIGMIEGNCWSHSLACRNWISTEGAATLERAKVAA
jgi:hypothetical protein